jgi:superoxide dismutase
MLTEARIQYLAAIWNVINWQEAEQRYTEASGAKL